MKKSQFLSRCTADTVKLAAQRLLNGDLVAFPTETVYGLGADALNSKAVSRIYEVKGRPLNHPLIVHLHNLNQMNEWVNEVPEYAIKLARDYWPGPMTLILHRSSIAGDLITGGQDSVGIRIPDHPIALALLENLHGLGGRGIAAPSANRFGHVSPTTADAVSKELSQFLFKSDMILDGGQCAVGVESTIIDCTNKDPTILRPGAISLEMIQDSIKFKINQKIVPGKNRASGMLEKHYAPKCTIILNEIPIAGQGYLAFSSIETPPGVVRLASPNSIEDFAQILYITFRKADEMNLKSLVVQQPEGDGIAVAIRDRLAKASKGR